jgi:hypothetical protein
MKQYFGHLEGSNGLIVNRVEDDVETPLPLRLDLRNHSPTGFSVGYTGSGPAQLALAILADYKGDNFALRHYQQFKREVIAALPQGKPFVLTEAQIDTALEASRGR